VRRQLDPHLPGRYQIAGSGSDDGRPDDDPKRRTIGDNCHNGTNQSAG